MKQILQVFSVIFPFTSTLCLAMTLDLPEKLSINHGTYSATILDENTNGSVANRASSPETSPVTWRDKKEPVDLSAFLGLNPVHLSFSSYKQNLRPTATQNLQEKRQTKKKVILNGVATFVKIYYPQNQQRKTATQAPAIQSCIGDQNAHTIMANSGGKKKRKLVQSSLLNFLSQEKRQKDEDSTDYESLTQPDSLARPDSLTNSSSISSASSECSDDSL